MRRRASSSEVPQGIHLPAVGETWTVCCRASESPGVSCRQRGDTLVLSGHVANPTASRDALRRWLKRRTHATLTPVLRDLAAEHRLLMPENVRVGLQRSRWGSCSSRDTISLNAKLLFLPSWLARSVVLHELCHLEHLDHSREFYALLERVDPDQARARKALRDAQAHVPTWVDADAEPSRGARHRRRWAQ